MIKEAPYTHETLQEIRSLADYLAVNAIAKHLGWEFDRLRRIARRHAILIADPPTEAKTEPAPAETKVVAALRQSAPKKATPPDLMMQEYRADLARRKGYRKSDDPEFIGPKKPHRGGQKRKPNPRSVYLGAAVSKAAANTIQQIANQRGVRPGSVIGMSIEYLAHSGQLSGVFAAAVDEARTA